MLALPSYTLTSIAAETPSMTPYRGHRQSDGRRVIVKVLEGAHPAPLAVARLTHEHEILFLLAEPSEGARRSPPAGLASWEEAHVQ